MHLMSLALQVDTILHVTAEFSFELLKKFKPSIKKKKKRNARGWAIFLRQPSRRRGAQWTGKRVPQGERQGGPGSPQSERALLEEKLSGDGS